MILGDGALNFENVEYDEKIRRYRLEHDFSPGVIANRLKVDREFIQFRLRRLGLRFRYRTHIENPEAIREAIRANPELTHKEIAEKMGLTYENVRWQARQMGIRRKNQTEPIDDNVLIGKYCSELWGAAEIAKTYRYSVPLVYRRLKELGLKRDNAERYRARDERKSRKTGRSYPSAGRYPLMKIPEGHVTRSRCLRSGFAFAHIIEMETKLGRPLTKAEKVHHIDFNKRNFDIDNLYLCENNSTHARIHKSLEDVSRSLFKMGIVAFKPGKGYYLKKKPKEEDLIELPEPTDSQPAQSTP